MTVSTLDFQVKDDGRPLKSFLGAVQESSEKISKGFKNLFTTNTNVSNQFASLSKNANNLSTEFKALIKENDNLIKKFGLLAGAGVLAAKTIGTLFQFSDIKEMFDTVADGVAGVVESFNDLGRAYAVMQENGFSTAAIEDVRLLGEVFKGNTQAAEVFAVKATAAFNEYDAALTRVNTLIKTNRQELGQAGAALQELVSKDLKNAVTSTEALAGQYEVLSGGFTETAQAQQVLTAGLKLATAGQADQGETLRLLVKTMQAYKISSEGAAKTAAVLNGIVEQGITTVPELTRNFGQTAVTAKAAGIALEELGAATAVLTTKGTTTDTALTGIESLSSIIIDKTPEAAKALAELRDEAGKPIRFDISEIKAKGLVKALQDLNKAIGGNATKLAEIIPESLAYSTALSLMQNNAEDLANATSKLGEVTAKNLDEVFGISLGDKTQKFTQIVNRFGEVLIKFGQAIAPAFEAGIDALDKISQFLISMPDWVKNTAVSFVLLGIGANKAFGAISSLSGMVVKLISLYISQRAIGLLLEGTLMKEVEVVKQLVAAKAGLIPIIKQILGIDQEYLLSTKAGNKLSQDQINNSEAVAEAISKEVAVKKSRQAVDKATTVVKDANEKLAASAKVRNDLESIQARLLEEQAVAKQKLLDLGTTYEDQIEEATKLAVIEEQLAKNRVGLEKAKADEAKKSAEAQKALDAFNKADTSRQRVEENALEVLKERTKTVKLQQEALVQQGKVESERLALGKLEDEATALRIEKTKELTASKILQTQASKAVAAADALELKASQDALKLGEDSVEVLNNRAKAKILYAQAAELQNAIDTGVVRQQTLSNALEETSLEISKQKIVVKQTEAAASKTITAAKKQELAANILEENLNRQRLITEGKLIKARIFGSTVYATTEVPILGKLNALLTQKIALQAADNKGVSIGAIITGTLAVAQKGLAGALMFVKAAAEKAWKSVLGPLAPILVLVGAVTAGVAVLFKAFTNFADSNKLGSEFQKLNKELDAQKEKLDKVNESWKNYSKDYKKLNAFALAIEYVSGAFNKAKRAVEEFFGPLLDIVDKVSNAVGGIGNRILDALGPVGALVRNLGNIFENFFADGIVSAQEEIRAAQDQALITTTNLIKATKDYSNGLYATKEANDKLRAGVRLTIDDLGRENKVFEERKKLVQNEITDNEKRIEQIDELINKKGKDSNEGKKLAAERDLLIQINEQERERLDNMVKAKEKLDAITEARNQAYKFKELNINEVIPEEVVIESKARADIIKDNIAKTLGDTSKDFAGISKQLGDLSDDQVTQLRANIKNLSADLGTGLYGVKEAVKKTGLDLTRLNDEQINRIKDSLDSGNLRRVKNTLKDVATETKQDFSKLNAEQKDNLLKNYQEASQKALGINKETLDQQLKQFDDAFTQFQQLRQKQKATQTDDLGGTAFQTAANKAFRAAKEDLDDYLRQYKAVIDNQMDAQGNLVYVTAENEKKYQDEMLKFTEENAKLKEANLDEYNKKLNDKTLELNQKYATQITLSTDQIKQGYGQRLQSLIQQGDQALAAGGKTASQVAEQLRAARDQIGDLIRPEETQQISQAIIDLEKSASERKIQIWENESQVLQTLEQSRLATTSETQTKLLQIESDRIDEQIALKQKEIDEYKRSGMTQQAEMAEKQLTALTAQQSAIRRKIADQEIDNRYVKQKQALAREAKLLDTQSETISMIAQQQEKLAKSRFDVARAQADLEITTLENKSKLTNDEVTKAENALEIEQKNAALIDAKFQMEEQSIKTQNILAEIALKRQKIQIELNKLELQANILKAKSAMNDKDVTEEKKAELQNEVDLMEKQQGMLNEQSKVIDDAIVQQKEVSANALKELGIRKEIAKQNAATNIELAKIEVAQAKINKYIKQVETATRLVELSYEKQLSSLDAQQKIQEEITKLFETRKSIISDLSATNQEEYNLAEQNAKTEFGRRKIQREAAQERRKILEVQQKIEMEMFDLQLKSNKLARDRLLIENEIAKAKAKSEALIARANAQKVAIDPRSTQEEKAAAQAESEARDSAYASTLQLGDLLKVQAENETRFDDFKRLQMKRKQEAERGRADSDVAATTLSIADDLKVSKEARARAKKGSEELRSVVEELAQETTTDTVKDFKDYLALAMGQLGKGQLPGVNTGAALPTPVNTAGSIPISSPVTNTTPTTLSNANSASVSNVSPASVNAPITINIQLSPDDSNPKNTADEVGKQVVKSLTEVFRRTDSLFNN